MAKTQRKLSTKRLQIESLESRVMLDSSTVLTAAQVQQLLERASAASASQSAVIAVVDRGGNILGVRAESGLNTTDQHYLNFAIDGAVAEARTAALFSNDAGALTSRTVQFISQSTITQREVQSTPDVADHNSTIYGPGLVAPVGIGGLFPPGIDNTSVADLFEIELSNRTPITNNFDSISTTINASESYGQQSGIAPYDQSRGIGTLPGGIPLYENGILVGAIGVFFPGPSGFSDYEQNFVPGVGQSSTDRLNSPLALEAEWIAFAAAGGSSGAGASVGTLGGVAPLAGFDLPGGPGARIDLAGITLPSVGATPGPLGVQQIMQVGASVGRGDANNGGKPDQPVNPAHQLYIDGITPPDGWLVSPRAGRVLSQSQVTQIIDQGITAAADVRAQIRALGSATRMVFAVADTDGTILGLYRMPDATVFSVDVAVAKARNTAYYANPNQLQSQDQIAGIPSTTAFTNRTFRFLAEPRLPEGVTGAPPGPFSILNDPGVNPQTGENIGPALPASAYSSVLGYAAFHPGTNFHAPTAIANQNGVVFFPGSTPLYVSGSTIAGGFGVSGDGVGQDDVVTSFGQVGYAAPSALRADQFFVTGVRLPFQEFPRNPLLPTPQPPPPITTGTSSSGPAPAPTPAPAPPAQFVGSLADFLARTAPAKIPTMFRSVSTPHAATTSTTTVQHSTPTTSTPISTPASTPAPTISNNSTPPVGKPTFTASLLRFLSSQAKNKSH